MGVSVTNVRHLPGAANAMAQGPDGLLVDLFPADLDDLAPALRDHFDNTT